MASDTLQNKWSIHAGLLLVCIIMGIAISSFKPVLVVGAAFALVILMMMFVWPEIGTLVVVFYIYANLAVIVSRFHGVPFMVAGAFPLLLCVPLTNYLIVRRERLIIDQTFLLMLLYLVVLFLSSFFAKDMRLATAAIVDYVTEGLAVYLLVINVIRDFEMLRRVIWVLMLTGALLGGLSLYQAATDSYDNQYGGFAVTSLSDAKSLRFGSVRKARAPRRSKRAHGSVGEPNRYAQTMIVLTPLAFFLFRTARSRTGQIGALAAAFFIIMGVMLSFSRAGFLTLVLMLLILVFLKYIRVSHLLLGVGVLSLIVVIAAPEYILRIASIGGVESLYSEDAEMEADGAITGRVTEMLAASMVFLDHPILGVGPKHYMPHYSVKYQLNADIAFRHIPIPRRAHTLYLELAAETGIIGLGVFMAMVLLLMLRLVQTGRRYRASSPGVSLLATACWLGLFGYLVSAIFLHLAYQRYYWFLLALSGAALEIIRSRTVSAEKRTNGQWMTHSSVPQTVSP